MNQDGIPRKSFFDMIMENKSYATKKPDSSVPSKEQSNALPFLGSILRPFIHAFFLFLTLNVMAGKFSCPTFSYFESLEVYFGVWCVIRGMRN